MENKRRKVHEELEVVQTGFANGVAEGFPFTDKQKEIVESVIIEMCFNLGRPRVLKFKMFIQALNDKDFRKAADEMMDSRWAVQVKERAVALSTMIRGL